MATPDWNWQKRAACHGEDLYLFFGHDGEQRHERLAREEIAKRICDYCPVLRSCRQTAFVLKLDAGVWGGLGEDERQSKRRSWIRRGGQRGVTAA